LHHQVRIFVKLGQPRILEQAPNYSFKADASGAA